MKKRIDKSTRRKRTLRAIDALFDELVYNTIANHMKKKGRKRGRGTMGVGSSPGGLV